MSVSKSPKPPFFSSCLFGRGKVRCQVGSGAGYRPDPETPCGMAGTTAAAAATTVPDSETMSTASMGDEGNAKMRVLKERMENADTEAERIAILLVELQEVYVNKKGGEKLDTHGHHGRDQVSYVKQKGIESVPVFDSKHEDFEPFKMKLYAFLSDQDGVTDALDWVIKQEDDITETDLNSYMENYNKAPNFDVYKCSKAMRSLLVMKTNGDSNTMVGNTSIQDGLLAWQHIAHEYGKISPQGRRRLLKQILWPSTAKTMRTWSR